MMGDVGRSIEWIAGGTVFAGEDVRPGRFDIRISEGDIVELAPAGAAPDPSDPSVLDATGSFVLPGFVDCHDHLRNILPGYAFGSGDLDSFLQAWWESQRLMGPEEYRLGANLGAVQRLRAGITTVVDHCYPYHRPGLDDVAIDGLAETGIKFGYARGIMTRPYEPLCETWDEAADRIRAVAAGGKVPLEQLFVAPVSIRQATPQEFGLAVELADELGAGLYTHVAETAAEIDVWQELTGTTPILALDEIGFLNERTILVHCVRMEGEEIELLAARGTHVIHCPTNHMKLAKGFTPVPELLEGGVNVALGVDMMADMLTEIRTEVGMHAVHRQIPDIIPTSRVLQMATIAGARAVGAGARTGSIEPGKAADLAVVAGRNIDHGPVIDPAFALVYTANTGMVTDVLVDGSLVVAGGVCQTIDEEALLSDVEDAVGSYLDRLSGGSLWWDRPSPGENPR